MLITNKIIKTINSEGLKRRLLKLINLVMKKQLFFASSKTWKWGKGAENSALWLKKHGNKARCSAEVCLFFLFEFHLKGTQVQTLFEDIPLVMKQAVSRIPQHTSLMKETWQCLRTIISFLDLRNISNYSRSVLTPSNFKMLAYCDMVNFKWSRSWW
jgi:hypothetical protein